MKLHEQTQIMTNRAVSAVSYYIDEDSYLPGMIRPHVYKGWHAYWHAKAPNGSNMTCTVVGPYDSREEALSALYQPFQETFAHKETVKAKFDANAR